LYLKTGGGSSCDVSLRRISDARVGANNYQTTVFLPINTTLIFYYQNIMGLNSKMFQLLDCAYGGFALNRRWQSAAGVRWDFRLSSLSLHTHICLTPPNVLLSMNDDRRYRSDELVKK